MFLKTKSVQYVKNEFGFNSIKCNYCERMLKSQGQTLMESPQNVAPAEPITTSSNAISTSVTPSVICNHCDSPIKTNLDRCHQCYFHEKMETCCQNTSLRELCYPCRLVMDYSKKPNALGQCKGRNCSQPLGNNPQNCIHCQEYNIKMHQSRLEWQRQMTEQGIDLIHKNVGLVLKHFPRDQKCSECHAPIGLRFNECLSCKHIVQKQGEVVLPENEVSTDLKAAQDMVAALLELAQMLRLSEPLGNEPTFAQKNQSHPWQNEHTMIPRERSIPSLKKLLLTLLTATLPLLSPPTSEAPC